jgi:hypothetical protein
MAPLPQMPIFPGQYTVQDNCQAAQPLCMNIIVVSKEELEAPWRLECQYLQSLVTELEKKLENSNTKQIIEKTVVDNTRVELLES